MDIPERTDWMPTSSYSVDDQRLVGIGDKRFFWENDERT